MAQFSAAVLTRKGIALLAKAQAEKKTITFTRAVTGSGSYESGEDISSLTALKDLRQSFAPTTIQRQNETNVFVRFSITNNPDGEALEHGYYITEIGLMANDPDEGEILYGIAIAEEDKADYLPAYNNLLPAVIGVDFLIEVDNAENVAITTDLSAYATTEDLAAKADHIAWDADNSQLQLKANGQIISVCTITFDGVDLSAYAKKASLKLSYDDENEKLSLKHDDDVLSEIDLPRGGGDIDYATEEDIQAMIDDLPIEDVDIITDDDYATDGEVSEIIDDMFSN